MGSEMCIRDRLEADNEEDDEEERGELNDDELNELLARSEEEVAKFQQVDRERAADEEIEWRAMGNTGPMPDRLMQESELPEMYQRDFDAENIDGRLEEEQPLTRRRNVVHYDDGLTEDQFLRALEGEEDLNEVVERKRERAEKRRLKQLGQGETDDGEGTKQRRHRSETPADASTERKRKQVESEGAPANSSTPLPASDSSKRRKVVDPAVERMKQAQLECYYAVENATEPDTGLSLIHI